MNAIEKLVAAGIDRESAGETVLWFLTQGDEEKLRCYIKICENRMQERMSERYA